MLGALKNKYWLLRLAKQRTLTSLEMAAHLKKRVNEEFSKVVQLPQEEAPAKKLRLTKASKSSALHIDLCKASNPTDALQYLLHFARSSVEAECGGGGAHTAGTLLQGAG